MAKSGENPSSEPLRADETSTENSSSRAMSVLKSLAACALLFSAYATWNGNTTTGSSTMDLGRSSRRQLSAVGDAVPKYMEGLMKDLRERQKLFEETPPEEVKYWFEYTGPLQVSVTKTQHPLMQ